MTHGQMVEEAHGVGDVPGEGYRDLSGRNLVKDAWHETTYLVIINDDDVVETHGRPGEVSADVVTQGMSQ